MSPMVAHYKVESRHHPHPLGRPRARGAYPLRRSTNGWAGAATHHALVPAPQPCPTICFTTQFLDWKDLLHLIYCVPKLHIHHAATHEGWTSVSATPATVLSA